MSGAQTVDGVAVTDHLTDNTGLPPDRVLVKNQADQTTNGIYSVSSTGAWVLAGDWQGAYNAANGTLVSVNGGSTQTGLWQLTTPDPVVIVPAVGSGSNITFAQFTLSTGTATNATNIGTTAVSTNANYFITGVAASAGGFQPAEINANVFYNPSTGTVGATNFVGTGANLSGNASIQNLTVTGTCSGCSGTASLSLSGLIAATTTNAIDSGNKAQIWAWNTLGANNALTLSTTNATTGALLGLSEMTTGAGFALNATLTGTSNTGYAGYFTNPSTSGYAVYAAGAEKVTGVFTASGNVLLSGTTTVANLNATTLNTGSASLGGTTTANNLTVTGTCSGCGGGALIPLPGATVNASGAAQVVFTSTYITSAYNKYVVEADGVTTSDGDLINMQVSTNNGGTYYSTGTYVCSYTYYSGGATGNGCGVDSRLDIGGPISSSSPSQLRLTFSNPSASAGHLFGFHVDAPSGRSYIGGGTDGLATPINNIKLYDGNGGTITGNFHLYAYMGT